MYIGGDGGIIDITRRTVLDDTEEDYAWKDIELIHYLNIIYEEICRELLLIEDDYTVALTQLKLLSNLGVYDLSELILNVKEGAKLSVNTGTDNGVLQRVLESDMDKLHPAWRENTGTPGVFLPNCVKKRLSVYPKFDDEGEYIGDGDISFTALTKTISQPGGDFSDLEVGDEINIDGTDDNDGYKTVATAGTTSFTVNEVLVNEANTSAVIRKVRDTLLMVVYRLPLAPFTVADIDVTPGVTPEIKASYHRFLPYGIGREAFLKKDRKTYHPNESKENGDHWEQFKAGVKAGLIF